MYIGTRWVLSVVFIGTPHQGRSDFIEMSQNLRRVGLVFPEITHRELQMMNESWMHILHNYRVVNFYETMPSVVGPLKMVRLCAVALA